MDPDSATDALLSRVHRGEQAARETLFSLHRQRLKRMIQARIDARISSRIDASDVVQETLAEASRKLEGYLRDRPLPFYPWLRQIAWNRMIDLYRKHIVAQSRTVTREEAAVQLNDESEALLARRLVGTGTSPSVRIQRSEARDKLRSALEHLNANDRELILMRHLEGMSVAEIAALLEIREGAAKTRLVRALQRLRSKLV